jgi:A/G-specific adenine glycosylase
MNQGDGKAERITLLLLEWYDGNKRTFPFRGSKEPYKVWLSEIMLQQTRTETVSPYYISFLSLFPDVHALAGASEEVVLKAWEGLGYYSRARNLHKTARIVSQEMGGRFPESTEDLQKLPGIGPYAAAAIASIAYDKQVPAMDGNLSRVVSRLYLVEEEISIPRVKRMLFSLGQALMPSRRAGEMNQALMDLGSGICFPGRPDCARCPLSSECLAFADGAPARLPVMKQKKPPLIIPVAVTLIQSGSRILLFKRGEALLHGMYVFQLSEGNSDAEAALSAAREVAGKVDLVSDLGAARHVFTHRVWEMRLYHVWAEMAVSANGGIWANAVEIRSLPLPVAMNAAKKAALRLLG